MITAILWICTCISKFSKNPIDSWDSVGASFVTALLDVILTLCLCAIIYE